MSLIIICGLFPLGAAADETDGLSYEMQDEGAFVSGYDEQYGSEVVIPKEYNGKPVIGIWYSAFENCNSITSVTIPDSVLSIEDYAFNGCGNLAEIKIPDSVEFVGDCVFEGTPFCSNPDNYKDGCMYIGSSFVKASTSLSGDFKIREGTKNISGSAFLNCKYLTSVDMPDTVEKLGESVFYGCISLKSVSLSKKIQTIESKLFYGCKSLTSITLPTNVWLIRDYAFYDCSNLAEINIPGNITSVGNSALEGTAFCNDPKNYVDGGIYIGNSLVRASTSFSGDFKVREGINHISGGAFSGCKLLTSIEIPDDVWEIG